MRFAFDVMASGKAFCNKQDVIGLVSLLHSEKARVMDTTKTLMGIMDPHNRDKVSFDTFRCVFVEQGVCPALLSQKPPLPPQVVVRPTSPPPRARRRKRGFEGWGAALSLEETYCTDASLL